MADDDIINMQEQILLANLTWNSGVPATLGQRTSGGASANTTTSVPTAIPSVRRRRENIDATVGFPAAGNETAQIELFSNQTENETLITHVKRPHVYSIEEKVAHILHKASITILGILCVEVTKLRFVIFTYAIIQLISVT